MSVPNHGPDFVRNPRRRLPGLLRGILLPVLCVGAAPPSHCKNNMIRRMRRLPLSLTPDPTLPRLTHSLSAICNHRCTDTSLPRIGLLPNQHFCFCFHATHIHVWNREGSIPSTRARRPPTRARSPPTRDCRRYDHHREWQSQQRIGRSATLRLQLRLRRTNSRNRNAAQDN